MRRYTRLITGMTLLLSAAAGTLIAGCSGTAESYSDPSRSAQAPAARARHSGMAPGAQAASDASAALRASSPAGSLPSLDEEVWVIVKDSNATSVQKSEDELPGCGAMVCNLSQGEQITQVPLPLKHTEVHASISAYIASVEVTQQFQNPYDSKIEAVYVFPLPDNAAVNGFVMIIGERKIRGIIREREEAQQIYNEAKRQGYVASLLTQERPNIFTQHVANIEPGRQIDVNITYFHTLAYDDGWYEYVFPMVVGPRFNPPGSSDGVAALARGTPQGSSGQKTEVQYLRPNERSGHDINVTVDITSGVPIEEIICRSHTIEVLNESSEQVRVSLDEDDRIPNKDFVLRYRVAGEQVRTALLVHRDTSTGSSGDGYFTFMLYPPQQASNDAVRAPLEMIFVLDCSGSMNGKPIEQAKAAIDHALTQLRSEDTFQIVQFSNAASQLGPQPIAATPENIRRGREYVRSITGEGGTMMIHGIRAALNFDHDAERLRIVTFLTDGYIGNEREILGEVHRLIGESRIFSFGVGSSVNRYLLERMAKLGRGAVAYLGLNDSGRDVMNAYLARISQPILTDIEIDWGGLQVTSVMPARIPDLFTGRPVIVTGKFAGDMKATGIRVRGRAGNETVEARVPIDPATTIGSHPALASVWARMHIAELMDQAVYDSNSDLPQMIKAVALEYGLMSAYTSFVAVDSSRQTEGTHGTTVQVAVPVPQGVRYETTVRE